MQQTLILFKPDAVQRRLCGRILTRIEERGLQLVALKLLKITPELSRQHYAEHVSKPFYPQLEGFITSGPVVALVVEGPGAVQVVRDMMGKTNARESAPGTIRGDFGLSRQVNLIHGSDSPESAQREIAIYFRPEELIRYESTLAEWVCADDERA
ncbi:nucleoside-diphosphate kinase [Planctomicrobium sp. SH664]|uniref:nucleoside-diphosphate kinase n=1 Tax=Planctomicrobium sp. SH664 TaxID=3448125 RepID=UPI003F5BFD42